MLCARSSAIVVSQANGLAPGACSRGRGRAASRGQREQAADRAVELARVAAGEVGARRAVVGHEEGVADEHRVADHVGQVGRACGRDVHHDRSIVAEPEALAVLEQLVELRAVARELRAVVEDLSKTSCTRMFRAPMASLPPSCSCR